MAGLRFRVVDPHGDVVRDAHLTWTHLPSGRRVQSGLYPDDDGVSAVGIDDDDRAITLAVVGRGPTIGMAGEVTAPVAAARGGDVAVLRLAPDPALERRLPVRVVDDAGRAIAGAQVAVFDDHEDLLGPPGAAITTGADGRAIAHVRARWVEDFARPVHVLAWAPGRAIGHAARTLGAADETDAVEVALPAGLTFAGTLRGSRGERLGGPLARLIRARRLPTRAFWLEALDLDDPTICQVRIEVDARGRFRAAGIRPGRYRVTDTATARRALTWPRDGAPRFEARRYHARREPGETWEPLVRELDLRADAHDHRLRISTAPRLIRGRVVDEAGAPVAGARVEVGDAVVTTDAAGAFARSVPPVDRLHVDAFHPDFGRCHDLDEHRHRYTGAPPRAPITLVLVRGVRVTGVIADADGAPRPGAGFLFIPPWRGSGPYTEHFVTDERGRFDLGTLVVGSFMILREEDWGHPDRWHRAGQPPPDWRETLRAGRPLTIIA